MMHSWGGVPGDDTCKGLSKEERTKDGKRTDVVGLVYVAAIATILARHRCKLSISFLFFCTLKSHDFGKHLPGCC